MRVASALVCEINPRPEERDFLFTSSVRLALDLSVLLGPQAEFNNPPVLFSGILDMKLLRNGQKRRMDEIELFQSRISRNQSAFVFYRCRKDIRI